MWPLQALEGRLPAHQGPGNRIPPLRPAVLQGAPRPRQIRLVIRRRDVQRAQGDGNHAHRRPVPLRHPRLDRRLRETPLRPPGWIGGFANPAFPRLFAEYAKAFAGRYPWVRRYTPVNEIYVTATFS